MEPAQGKVRFVVYTKVSGVKDGYVHFEGSHESIFLGDCGMKVGDNAKITFEVINAQPKQSPK